MPLIDFGCHSSDLLSAVPDALAVIILFGLLAALGSSLGGRARWAPADLITGWGRIVALFTVAGLFLPGSFTVCALMAGGAALITMFGNIFRQPRIEPVAGLLIGLFIQFWILLFIDHKGLTGWDDIAQWTPNAIYLWRHGLFPGSHMPLPYSNRPGYPDALAYLDYIVSLARGAFVIQAGAMISWLLLTSFAYALTRFDDVKRAPGAELMRFGIALSLVTLLNPGFNASFTVTGQSDTATSVVLGFLVLLVLQFQRALVSDDRKKTYALAGQMASASIALVMLRDMNIILLATVAGGSLLLSIRDRVFWKSSRLWMLSLIFPTLFFFLWRHYTGANVVEGAPPAILPFAAWRWSLAPQLLGAAAHEILKKNGFYGLMFGISGYALYALLGNRRGELSTLAILSAGVFLGYTAFILVAFLGSSFFTEHNITHAMSFYRYGTHTGLPGIAMLWFLFERHVEHRIKPQWLIPLAVASLALLPLAFVVKSSVLVPNPNAGLCPARQLGDEIAEILPPASRLAIFDTNGNGFETYIINLELALDDLRSSKDTHVVASADMFDPDKSREIESELLERADINAVMLRNPTLKLKSLFGLKNEKDFDLLLRDGNAWKELDLPVADARTVAPKQKAPVRGEDPGAASDQSDAP